MSFSFTNNFLHRFCLEEFQLHTGSHSSFFSSDLLPSLGANVNPEIKLRRYMVSPFNPRYRAWEMFLVLLVIYSAWICPFEFAFLTYKQDALFIIDNIVNGFFAIDIILTFFVAYLDTQSYLLVDDPKKIAIRYLSTWFIFDVCSTAPFQPLSLLLTDHSTGLGFKVLNMLRLWRLRRVSSLFARLEKDIRFNYFWTRCTKLISVTLFAVHCAGCFNYLIAERYPDQKRTWIGAVYTNYKEQSLWDRYVTAMYWSIVTLTTTGYGDLHAENTREMLNILLVGLQRDTIRSASEFAKRNRLPPCMEDQILSHICLKFKAEGLKQQETLNSLPKAIRSSIAHHLFFPIIQNVSLFQGVSHDYLFQVVSEMEAEYFPPKEDVILQNEAPTDLYILVSGAVVLIANVDEHDQVLGKAAAGEMFGEIGVLCHTPQPFTVRTTEISQILRLNKTTLMNIIRANAEDGRIIMNNFYQKLKGLDSFGFADQHKNADMILSEWLDGGPKEENTSVAGYQENIYGDTQIQESRDTNLIGSDAIGQSYENRTVDEHKIEFFGPETFDNTRKVGFKATSGVPSCSDSQRNSEFLGLSTTRYPVDTEVKSFNNTRVTIHMKFQNNNASQKRLPKLIILPDSIEELFRIAGRKFGGYNLTKIVNSENAEIDDLNVIRDGDHLFLLPNEGEIKEYNAPNDY
ncbi:hypothetical protein LguiB_004856 [Lonicera macranthoides]